MAYIKNNWAVWNPELTDEEQPEAFLTKDKLENIENGIEEAHKLIEAVVVTNGTDGKDGVDGKDGYTPVKGIDYFTEDDKKEMVDAVVATRRVTPYFNEEANVVAGCGVHITVEAANEEGKLRIHWFDKSSKPQEMIVPEGVRVCGGGCSADVVEYYPAASITLNSGYVDAIIGGCYGNGNVGHTTVIINGGTFKNTWVCGGGMHWGDKSTSNNRVGHAEVFVNGTGEGEIETLFCGTMSGDCSTGSSTVTVNDGNIGWLSGGGSNSYTGFSEIIVNDGNVKVLQGCNRGVSEIIKLVVNGGTINNLYAGGETADTSVNGVYSKAELRINGGTIKKISCGTNGGVEDASKVFGGYRGGVITDEDAAALHLVKVMTIDDLYNKLVTMGVLTEVIE